MREFPHLSNVSSSAATRRNTLKRARQGDANAIADLVNHFLSRRRIIAQANLQQDCLWILLEGAQTPPQAEMVQFLYTSISKLEIPTLSTIRVYGRRLGQPKADWTQDISLAPTAIPPLNPDVPDSPTVHYLRKLAEQMIRPAAHAAEPMAYTESSPEQTVVPLRSTRTRVAVLASARQPVASQIRLMGLQKILTMVVALVAGGNLIQQFDRLHLHDSAYSWVAITTSLVMVVAAVVTIISLVSQDGTELHPKYAQIAYLRLGTAFLVNVGCAAVLLLLVSTGLLVPRLQTIMPLFVGCIGFWIWGCTALAKAKGYARYWGILGVLLVDGVIVLSLFPSRLVQSTPRLRSNSTSR